MSSLALPAMTKDLRHSQDLVADAGPILQPPTQVVCGPLFDVVGGEPPSVHRRHVGGQRQLDCRRSSIHAFLQLLARYPIQIDSRDVLKLPAERDVLAQRVQWGSIGASDDAYRTGCHGQGRYRSHDREVIEEAAVDVVWLDCVIGVRSGIASRARTRPWQR